MAQFVSLENPAKRTLRGINDDLLKSATTRPDDRSFPLFCTQWQKNIYLFDKISNKILERTLCFSFIIDLSVFDRWIWEFRWFLIFFLRFLNITFMAVSFYFNCLYKIVGKSCNIVIIWILLSEWLKNSTTKKTHTHTHTKEILIKYFNVVYCQCCVVLGFWWVTKFFCLTKVFRRNGCIKYGINWMKDN